MFEFICQQCGQTCEEYYTVEEPGFGPSYDFCSTDCLVKFYVDEQGTIKHGA